MKTRRSLAVIVLSAIAFLLPARVGAAGGDPSQVGAWSAPIDVGVVGINAAMLHTGKVLLYQYPDGPLGSDAVVFDPNSGTFTDVTVPVQRNIFCSGLSMMADGRVLATGGEIYDQSAFDGIKAVTIFDPLTEKWSSAHAMHYARWYPTNVQMPDGTTLVMSGQVKDGQLVRQLESYNPATNTWTVLPRSARFAEYDLYPRTVLLPSGKVFRAGAAQMSRMFDPVTQAWSQVAPMNYGWRTQGTVVLLPGLQKVLTAGGFTSVDGTDTAEIIDLSQPSPHWQYTGSMNRARENLNLTLLADGTVLAVGGGQRLSYEGPVMEAELYDPATGQWTLMAAQQAQRMYHSTAVLLPDGRVLSAGSDSGAMQTTVELFSPPYLFQGPRPVVTSAPTSVRHGQGFTISTPNASDIVRVALVRPSAVTHAADMEQRYVDLSFTAGSGTISATAPADAAMAPAGYYMLFLVNSAGVPSVAPFVHLG